MSTTTRTFTLDSPILDPVIRGLLDALPPTHTRWDTAKQEKWLEAARRCFQLVYLDGEESAYSAK